MKIKKTISALCLSLILLSLSACDTANSGKKELMSGETSNSSVTSIQEVTETEENDNYSAEVSEESIESSSAAETELTEIQEAEQNTSDSIRPEIKEALDSYEAFMDEYCDFMKKYSESPDDLSLLVSYLDYMTKYTEAMENLDKIDDMDMNDAELKYYLEVTTRVSAKLIEASA